jgi:uncharacterized phage-associated protein
MVTREAAGQDSSQSGVINNVTIGVVPKGHRLPRWPFALDQDKVIEALLLVIPRITNPTMHSVSKILYQADRLHLSRYGRPITGDRYAAMRNGPVPSATYNILKTLRGDELVLLPEGAEQALAVQKAYAVHALRAPKLDVLSDSEQSCLTEAAAIHGAKGFQQLTDESHDEAWNAAGENDIIELEQFLLTLANRDELRAHFVHEDP